MSISYGGEPCCSSHCSRSDLTRRRCRKASHAGRSTNRRLRTRLVAEYWLQSNDPATIVILEADSVQPLMAVRAVWGDVFDITFIPAMTLEEGLAAAQAMAPQ